MEVLGDYELLQLIGEGATGVVHRARDRRSGQQVALEILHPEVTRTPETRERIVGELRQLVSLAHANVVCCRECCFARRWRRSTRSKSRSRQPPNRSSSSATRCS